MHENFALDAFNLQIFEVYIKTYALETFNFQKFKVYIKINDEDFDEKLNIEIEKPYLFEIEKVFENKTIPLASLRIVRNQIL